MNIEISAGIKGQLFLRLCLILFLGLNGSFLISVCGQEERASPPQSQQESAEKGSGGKHSYMPESFAENIGVRTIQLSHISPEKCLKSMPSYGITVLQREELADFFQQGKEVLSRRLPAVMAVPQPEVKNLNLPDGVDEDFSATTGSMLNQVTVFYHQNSPEEFSTVKSIIRETVDVSAKQLMIEAMVLEISEGSLKQLGVEWRLDNPTGGNFFNEKVTSDLKVGRIVPSELQNTAQLDVTFTNIFEEFKTQLQTLVKENKAKVMSRPSVLTLNNRMAQINVTKDIPIAETQFGDNQDIKAVNFKNVNAGIKLNVRPRVSAGNDWVTMQVVASVSARVPGEQEVVKNNDGEVLATSPTISHRTVKTHARIRNKTPFIVGGLVAEDDTMETQKVPLLGDIPFLGGLFRSKKKNKTKREVVIVLTPYILPKDSVVDRQLPKDADAFDSAGNKLFRDIYRIRDEDVFDLGFLTQNAQLQKMQEVVTRILRKRPQLKNKFPFRKFVDNSIPGERILVYRQIYEVIKRKNLAEPIGANQIIYFHPDKGEPAGFDVKFLDEKIRQVARRLAQRSGREKAKLNEPWKVLEKYNKALAMTYTFRRETGTAMKQPVPEVELVELTGDNAWGETLADMNKPLKAQGGRFTVVLQSKSDLERLKKAILVNKTIQLNAPKNQKLSFDDFSIGRSLLLPDFDETAIHLIDGDVAKYFYYTEQYYAALRAELRRSTDALQDVLEKPGFSRFNNIGQKGPPPSEVIPEHPYSK